MNALEKVAWTELIVSVLAAALVLALYPWLGAAAAGGFGLLGLLGITPFFLRKRGNEIIMDERDVNISQRASWWGFGTAWLVLMLSLVAITLWHSYQEIAVPTALLNIVIWVQFSLCYAIKGASSLFFYRNVHRAT